MTYFPILMYHALSSQATDERYTLSRERFRRHMSLLSSLGLRGASVSELLGTLNGVERKVAISFDDGHASDRSIALPILQEFGFTATFFVTTDRIGTSPEWMTWEDVEALKGAGMDIQAHGHTHRFLSDLEASGQELELNGPRELIQRKLGLECTEFSFPGGRYDASSIELARALGYRVLCTSEPGLNRASSKEFRLLKRFVVHQGLGDEAFRRIVTRDTVYAVRANLFYRVKQLAKRLLGNRTYHRIWSYLFAGRSS